MWILHFLPNGLVHSIVLSVLFSGIGLYILGLLINFLPSIRLYKEPIRILSTVLIIIGVYCYGSYATEMAWRQRVEEVQAKVAAAELESAKTNTIIEEKIVTQTKLIHDRQIVVQTEIQQAAQQIDKECKLDSEVIRILNNAALNPTVSLGDKK
jgi:uncharacterized protein YacL